MDVVIVWKVGLIIRYMITPEFDYASLRSVLNLIIIY
jgi:hypothetical protein